MSRSSSWSTVPAQLLFTSLLRVVALAQGQIIRYLLARARAIVGARFSIKVAIKREILDPVEFYVQVK